MAIWLQLLVNGLIAGSIYALVASGFSLIYATNRFVHFAHGASIVLSGYIMYWLFTTLGIPFFASLFLTIAFAGALGYSIFRGIYVPLKKKNSSKVILLIASVALLLLLENIILLVFGSDVKVMDVFGPMKGMSFGSITITPIQLTIIGVSLALLAGLYFFIMKSTLGRSMRAVSDNPGLADIMGISARRVQALSFIIGSAIAGLAAVLIVLEQNLEPFMGTKLMIRGFTAAVIGGITSVPGAILGSFLLGIVENIGIWYIPSGYKEAIAFSLLFIFLLFKPTGILGLAKGHRK